jgi:hypothetical protein
MTASSSTVMVIKMTTRPQPDLQILHRPAVWIHAVRRFCLCTVDLSVRGVAGSNPPTGSAPTAVKARERRPWRCSWSDAGLGTMISTGQVRATTEFDDTQAYTVPSSGHCIMLDTSRSGSLTQP